MNESEMQAWARKLADAGAAYRVTAAYRRWSDTKSSDDDAAERSAEDGLREEPAYCAWQSLNNQARAFGADIYNEIRRQVDAEETRRARAQAEAQDRQRRAREEELRQSTGQLGVTVSYAATGDLPVPSEVRTRRLLTHSAWLAGDLAASIKAIERRKVLGIPWGIRITLTNGDVINGTHRSFSHQGTAAGVRIIAAASRELGWRGVQLCGHPAYVARAAVLMVEEGVHVSGATPEVKRQVANALAGAGLANPPLRPRRAPSAASIAVQQGETDQILQRWVNPAVTTNTPAATPGTGAAPSHSRGPQP